MGSRVVAHHLHDAALCTVDGNVVGADFDDYVRRLDIRALSNQRVQIFGVRADAVDAPVDDTLRRVGAALFESANVLPLTVVVRGLAKGVGPAEVVPVGDFVGEDEEGWVRVDEPEDVGVGGGAGGAALGLEELEDGEGLGGGGGHCFVVGTHHCIVAHHLGGVTAAGGFHAGGLGGGHGVAGHGGAVGHGFFGHGGFGAVLAEGLEDVLHDCGGGRGRGWVLVGEGWLMKELVK